MQFSHSRVETFKSCPFKFKLRYIDLFATIEDPDSRSPLTLGSALHKGIETTVEEALEQYRNQYTVINDQIETECLILAEQINAVKSQLVDINADHEVKLEIENFIGFIDLVEYNNDGTVNLIDFKYSNNVNHYLESPQLSLYKYYYEKQTNQRVKGLYYIFIPKINLKQKKDETLIDFRRRCLSELKSPFIKKVEYNKQHVAEFKTACKQIQIATDYPKTPSYLCNWCEYQAYCEKGETYMLLPKPERVDVSKTVYRKIWIYGAPFSGKTVFADGAETPLNLNTDGNTKFVSMARLPIRDEVTQDGRIRRRKFAWEIFKDAIAELETGTEFKTIVVDLLEDTYEHCRLYMYDKLNIEHESDDSFRAWDKVRTEFLSTIKRLINLDYNIVLISHEDTSKDITRKTGDKITAIKPNMSEKIANKIAGMVDMVGRVIVEDDDSRTLNFKPNEVTFGGGRLKEIKRTSISLDWAAFEKLYGDTVKKQESEVIAEPEEKTPAKRARKAKTEPQLEPEQEQIEPETDLNDPSVKSGVVVEQPKRTRKTRNVVEQPEPQAEQEEQPRRRRRVRGE